MITTFIEKHYKALKYISYVLLASILVLIVYLIFGRMIIRGMYDGKYIGLFNDIIRGQSEHSVKYYFAYMEMIITKTLFYALLLSPILFLVIKPVSIIKWSSGNRWMEKHTDNIDSIPDNQLGMWIALAACLGLFLVDFLNTTPCILDLDHYTY